MRLLLLIVALSVSACAENFAELAKQATAAREQNHVDRAVQLYRKCVGLRPSWAEGWWYLGALLYDADAFEEARKALTRFVALNKDAAPGWALLGLSEYETKRYADALMSLEHSLRLGLKGDPEISKVARFHAGLLFTRSGQFELALQRYAQLATQGGEDPNMVIAIGLAALRIRSLPQEVPASQRDLVSQVGRAVYDQMSRRPEEAQREFEELVAQYPKTPEIHDVYGNFLLAGDPDAAMREWKTELEISPNHVPARLELAFEYLKRGEAAKGLPYAREAARLDPGSFAAHNALGRLLVETGDLRNGIAELEEARDLAPDSAETRIALASAYARASRSQDAARERAEFVRLKKLQDAAQ